MNQTHGKWIAGGLALLLGAVFAAAQVQHGYLQVTENDAGNVPASVTLNDWVGFGAWTSISQDGFDESNRGDYTVDFGTGNDAALGVLMTGPANETRVEPGSFAGAPYLATTQIARSGSGSGRYFIPIFRSPNGDEANYDVALAYFPIADGWWTGVAYNVTNGGPFSELVGTPGIALTNAFDPNIADPNFAGTLKTYFLDGANGAAKLVIDGVDLRRDGVLLVTAAKNEDNFGMTRVNVDGSANVITHDNGADGVGTEQDPVAFTFIPTGTPGVIMGQISGTGRAIYRQGDFDVQMVGEPDIHGTWRLTIPGENETTGTLIVVAAQWTSGNTIDNPVWATPADDDPNTWIITSRDMTGMGLQDIGGTDTAFVFAFFKNGVDIRPPATIDRPYLPENRGDDILSARFAVAEYLPTNNNGDMRADKVSGSTGLDVFSDNRGDIGITWLNHKPASWYNNGLDAFEGVWLGNPTEFFRDNSGTGGVSGWSTLSFDNGEARTHAATFSGGEINSNFALAFFPQTAGLMQDADVQVFPGDDPNAFITISGDAVNDGVCLAMNWDNNNRSVTVEPSGNTYMLRCYEGNNGDVSTDWDYGYAYIPYTTPGIVAGQVAEDGTIISGTNDGAEFGFTATPVTYDAGFIQFPATAITIPGVDARTDGVLIVTAVTGPYAMSWEAGPSGEFIVAGMELVGGQPGRTAFSFAWVPSDLDITPDVPTVCHGDVNCDGSVTFADIDPFVARLGCPNSNPDACNTGCAWQNADINDDGAVTFADIDPFVGTLGTTCP